MSSKGAKKEETKPTATAGTGNVMDDLSKKQAFKKFSYRGDDINKLLSLNMDELAYILINIAKCSDPDKEEN
jgi:hypothetical protein